MSTPGTMKLWGRPAPLRGHPSRGSCLAPDGRSVRHPRSGCAPGPGAARPASPDRGQARHRANDRLGDPTRSAPATSRSLRSGGPRRDRQGPCAAVGVAPPGVNGGPPGQGSVAGGWRGPRPRRARARRGEWSIGIEAPDGGSEPIAVVGLDSGSLCTSSTRLATWVDGPGEMVHHLVDPRTGRPGGEGLMAVTVAAADPAWAEIWSKALFLAGPAAIGDLARSRGSAAWWISEADGLQMTPAARQITLWP